MGGEIISMFICEVLNRRVVYILIAFFMTSLCVEAMTIEQAESLIKNSGTNLSNLDRDKANELALAYVKVGNMGGAQKIYELIIEKNSKDAPALRKLAQIQRKLKKYSLAISTYKKAIEANLKYEAAYLELSDTILEYKPKNRLEARLIYEDMILVFGEKSNYFSRICELATDEGMHEAAQKACKKTLQLDPANSVAKICLGHLLRDQGLLEEADDYFTKLISGGGGDYSINISAGKYFVDRGQWARAKMAYEQALSERADDKQALLGLAKSACQIQDLNACYLSYQKACEHSDFLVRTELRRSLVMAKISSQKDQIKKFQDLIISCNK